MGTPLYSGAEWLELFETGEMPPLFVDVTDFKARIKIMFDETYVDITEDIEGGKELAEDAVYSAGGGLNISGWYPPTKEIFDELNKFIRYNTYQ